MEFDNIVIVDLFRDVVDAMRETGTITSSSEVAGMYTLISSNTFKEMDVITIDDVDYLVYEPTASQFQIEAESGLDFAGKEWKTKAPYYMHGHPLEIVNRLNKKNKNIYNYQKYPLIALFQDFEEPIGDESEYTNISPRLIIANLTDPNIDASDRYDRNFRDILYPLYYRFIHEIWRSNKFNVPSPRKVPHTKIDRLYWGTSAAQGNESNLHDDFIDAIEINFNGLKVIDTRCKI